MLLALITAVSGLAIDRQRERVVDDAKTSWICGVNHMRAGARSLLALIPPPEVLTPATPDS